MDGGKPPESEKHHISSIVELLVLGIVAALAIGIRIEYFIGFALGDDFNYFILIKNALAGSGIQYDYLNQYAFRPLLLLSALLSFKLLGINEAAFILPVFLASIGGIFVAYYLGKTLFSPCAGFLAAFILAIYPFNIYNSVTFDNDVIISFFMGLVILVFIKARESEKPLQVILYVTGGFTIVVSYLFKMTSLSILGILGVFSLLEIFLYRKNLRQLWFYAAFAFFFLLALCFYKAETGEFFRHFKAENIYYDHWKNLFVPADYWNGNLNIKELLFEYPYHLFLPLTLGTVRFFEFGLYFYFFPPALVLMLWKNKNRWVSLFLFWWFFSLFLFLEFMPLYWDPYYYPLPRQERYLEIITLPTILTIAWFLTWMARRSKITFTLLLLIIVSSSLYYTHIRCTYVKDSIADLKGVSKWLCEEKASEVYVDYPGFGPVFFHTNNCNIAVKSLERIKTDPPSKGAYVLSGGSRMYLWERGIIRTVEEECPELPLTAVITYPESWTHNRKGRLTVYRYGG
ncbi:MAG: glycosyltransferase family 39 protein [Deltaproteobacteria bacterium]|nr:glycosyltransferase family 39 protein [Deltaproteobacteria bacterium]